MENWDFVANATVDTIDLVPETARGYYVEDKANGGFSVDPKVKPLTDALVGANKKMSTLGKQKKDDNQKDATRRAVIEGITSTLTEAGIEVGDDVTKLPETLKAKLTEIMDQVKGGKEVKLNVEAIKKDFEKRLTTELAKKDGELTGMRGSLEKHMIDNAALSALTEAGTVEKGSELIMPQLRRFVKVVKNDSGDYTTSVVDSDNNVRLNNKGEPMGIKDLVAEMKVNYPMAFKSENKGGGGKQPGTGKIVPGAPTSNIGNRQAGEKSAVDKIASGLATLGRN